MGKLQNIKGSINTFLSSKIVKGDVGEPTYLTWKETISYALGRGAQGMNTGMTGSKYLNFFLTDILFSSLDKSIVMGLAGKIKFFCGIFDAINDPIMGVIIDKTRTKNGQMRPYIKWAPIFLSLVMVLFFFGAREASYMANIIYTTVFLVGLDVTYTAFDIPMGALAFSITPNGVERTKLFGISSIVRSIVGALPAGFVAIASWLPYFSENTAKAYQTAAVVCAIGILLLTRITYANTRERQHHSSDTPSVKECFKLLFKNRPLLMLFLGNIFFLLCKIPEQVSFYFISDLMYDRRYNVFIDVIKFPGFLLAGLIVPKLIEKWGAKANAKKFYQICCVTAIVLHLLFTLTTYNGLMNKASNVPVSLFTAILVILFTGLTCIPLEFKNLMQKEMEAETVDYIEWKTGKRAEGIMLSIMSFTGKIENTVAGSIGLDILSRTNYITHEEDSLAQSDETNWALFLMTTLVPAVGYLLMLIPMKFYNITGESHRMMMEEIKARHALAADEAAQQIAAETENA